MGDRLKGKVALVTGGASGIGKVSAQIFARDGAKVIVSTDANIKGGEETVRLIKEAGGEATFVKCDVSRAEEVEAMIDKCVQLYGRLDYAFNNAGIEGPHFVPTTDYSEEDWDQLMDINLKGVWLCMKYAIPHMLEQSKGAIVNMSSVTGLIGGRSGAPYCASKHGVIGRKHPSANCGVHCHVSPIPSTWCA